MTFNASGLFDQDTGIIQYNFDKEPFLKVMSGEETSSGQNDISETYLHEITHLYQLRCTTFGFYYQSLRQFQIYQLSSLLRLLIATTKKNIFPIKQNITEIDPKVSNDIVFSYNLAFYLILIFKGDVNQLLRFTEKYRNFINVSIMNAITLMNFWLASYYKTNGICNRTIDENFDYSSELGAESFKNQALIQALKVSGFSATMDHKSLNSHDVESLAEGHATISEFFGSDHGIDYFDAKMRGTKIWNYNFIHYMGGRSIKENSHSLKDIVIKLLTICDLSFNPPILPNIYKSNMISFDEIHPLMRFFKICNVMAEKDFSDINSYNYEDTVLKITSKLNWISSNEITSSNASDYDTPHNDYLHYLFHLSQQIRKRIPGAFIDYGNRFSKDDLGDMMRSNYNFPVIIFRDTIMFHKDKKIVAFSIMNHLFNECMRQLYTNTYVVLQLPYHASNNEYDFYKNGITELFYKTFNVDLPLKSFFNGK